MNEFGHSLQELEEESHAKLEMFRELSPSVLKIALPYHPDPQSKYGTGFFISKLPPFILTAYHVIPDQKTCKKAQFQLNFNHPTRNPDLHVIEGGQILYSSQELDFSIIRLTKVPEDQYSAIPLEENDIPYWAPEISLIHHPFEHHKLINIEPIKLTSLNAFRDYLRNFIGGYDSPIGCTKDKNLIKLWYFLENCKRIAYWKVNESQLTKCTAGGSSGAPIFDNNNRIIGMHQGTFPYTPISYGIPIELILRDLKGLN